MQPKFSQAMERDDPMASSAILEIRGQYIAEQPTDAFEARVGRCRKASRRVTVGPDK